MPERWSFARRARNRGGAELTAILAGAPPGVLSLMGGFPNPDTFPAGVLDEIAARLVRDDAAVALQYTPCEGLPGVREYLLDRQEHLQHRRPELPELIVTSGGMECISLMCHALLDAGDTVAVEAPTYLGALMAFAGFEAEVEPIPMDADGLDVAALEERLDAGLAPKFLYVIPDYQNPTGRTMPPARREALVALCRRHGVLVFEDVAYRELCFDGDAAGVTVVAWPRHRAADGHLLEDLLPRRAARLGGRAARDRGRAGGGQAEHRPVRRRARPAAGRGVRPRRALRAPAPGRARPVRGALGRARAGARGAHAAGLQLDARRAAAFSPG